MQAHSEYPLLLCPTPAYRLILWPSLFNTLIAFLPDPAPCLAAQQSLDATQAQIPRSMDQTPALCIATVCSPWFLSCAPPVDNYVHKAKHESIPNKQSNT
jgi:hypothetical protein